MSENSLKGLIHMTYSFGIEKEDANLLNQIDIDFEQIMEEANIPMEAFTDSKFNLTEQQYLDAMAVIDRHIDMKSVLLYNNVENRTVFNPSLFAGLCAQNGIMCLERMTKYNRLNGPIHMTLTRNDDEAVIRIQYKNGTELPRFALVSQHISLVSAIRKGSGKSHIKPRRITTSHDYPREVAEFVGTRAANGHVNEIVFSMKDLLIPFITTNNNMWKYMEAELNKRMEELEIDERFSARVRKILFEIIPSGISDADHVAKTMGLSRRSLQRKLSEEGTTFLEQLNYTREMMVRNYLKMDMTLDEIAFLVNYSDAKSLSRAFKIWSGMSVTDYKKQL